MVPAGKVVDDGTLLAMNYYVKGVDGKLAELDADGLSAQSTDGRARDRGAPVSANAGASAMSAFLVDWLNLLIRWAHLVVGIGWIGTSFYFIALDLGLRKRESMPRGRLRHRLGGARRRLLPRREIPGRAEDAAARPDLVQVGGLPHLGHRLRPAHRPVLLDAPTPS